MPAQDTKIPTVKRTRINRSKFIGRGDDREELRSIHGSLSTLAGHVRANKKSVAINARKITILKNIEKLKRDPVGAKLPGGGGLAETLGSIAATVESIKNTLIGQQEVDEEAIKDEEQDAETAARAKQENKLESKIFSTLKTQGEKVIAPVKSLWGKIWDFFVKLFAGKVFMNVLEWFGDEKNTDKIKSMIRFVGDWWPAILGSIGVLLGGLLIVGGGPIAMMIGAAMFLAGALTPVIAALGIFGGGDAKKLEQRKKDLEKGLNDVDDDDGGGGEQNVNVEDQIQTDEEVLNEVNFFNKGGQVPGSGNTDSVPAMLTPGEFVMSKGAVQQYGANTLAGMNAAAGGTNRPTPSGGYNTGGKAFDRSHYGTEGYQIGQIQPDKLVVSKTSFTDKAQEGGASTGADFEKFNEDVDMSMPGRIRETVKYKEGSLVGEETFEEDIASIGVPDLLEHKDQLLSEIHAVPGYENITIGDVINSNVDMPLKQYLPILMRSDAQKATFAKMDAAYRRDKQIRGIKEGEGYSMGYDFGGGGLVPILGFAGGGLVQPQAQIKGNSKTPTIKPPPTIVKNSGGGGGPNKVTQINNKGKEGGKGDVPAIDAAAMRDREKIIVLGITV